MGIHPLLREPWAITDEGMALALAIASRDDVFGDAREKALAARDGKPLANARSVTVRDGVADIPVAGTMFRHADLLSAISGGVSYATLRKDLETALADPSVSAVLLNVDSPGGEVNGCAELADAIFAARRVKPIGAYVGGQGNSAACWLATATDRVYCSATSSMGSIGVCTSYTDTSKADEAEGKKTIQIVSTQSPDKNVDPMTESGRALLQSRLDAVANVFISDVARFRGVTDKKVAGDFGKGGVLIGAEAVRAGLADEVTNYESALADMAKRGAAAKQRTYQMGQEQEQLAALGAFERDVLAIAGTADRASALGALRGMQAAHAQSKELAAKVEQLMAAKRVAEFDALVKQGEEGLKITPAMARGEWIASLRAMDNGDVILKGYLTTAPKFVASAAEQPKEVALKLAAPGAKLKGTTAEGLNEEQTKAIAEYAKANPDASPHAALIGAMNSNPVLFNEGA